MDIRAYSVVKMHEELDSFIKTLEIDHNHVKTELEKTPDGLIYKLTYVE